jgi:putative addiction module component (TIGR02574 family)
MNASCESIISAAMKLPPEDRSQLATWLWESAASYMPSQSSEAEVETLLNNRESEMECDPSQVISHQDLMTHFTKRR